LIVEFVMHKPVLLEEAIRFLDPQSGDLVIDGTFGAGGHARLILEKIRPLGKLLALDWNEAAVKKCRQLYQSQMVDCAVGNFAQLPEIMKARGYGQANSLLLDLGVSSEELESSGRGFSFQKDEPLFMTYSDDQPPVWEILRRLSQEQLAKVIRDYGEEKFAGRIAAAIKSSPIPRTSGDLAQRIAQAVLKNYERGRIHPATRTFQALRIYANRELENLAAVLGKLEKILAAGGRAVIISFHSLEDRLVKRAFAELAAGGQGEILTKKPVRPTAGEIGENPRSRSAKLRAIKLG